MTSIILASGSPRRKELMGLLPISFKVITKEVDETLDEQLLPEENVCALAAKKARGVSEAYPDEWVIGCDTVVVDGQCILGKPKDEEGAKEMLRSLSGKSHAVYTGVSIQHETKDIVKNFFVKSEVKMKVISEEEIAAYVASKEPLDKAGSYGIQGKGSVFVEGIVGDYFNIVGLPVASVYEEMKKLELISL
ncbi:MAG: Maf family protein [Cellulosilyticaceae bacterium]